MQCQATKWAAEVAAQVDRDEAVADLIDAAIAASSERHYLDTVAQVIDHLAVTQRAWMDRQFPGLADRVLELGDLTDADLSDLADHPCIEEDVRERFGDFSRAY